MAEWVCAVQRPGPKFPSSLQVVGGNYSLVVEVHLELLKVLLEPWVLNLSVLDAEPTCNDFSFLFFASNSAWHETHTRMTQGQRNGRWAMGTEIQISRPETGSVRLVRFTWHFLACLLFCQAFIDRSLQSTVRWTTCTFARQSCCQRLPCTGLTLDFKLLSNLVSMLSFKSNQIIFVKALQTGSSRLQWGGRCYAYFLEFWPSSRTRGDLEALFGISCDSSHCAFACNFLVWSHCSVRSLLLL